MKTIVQLGLLMAIASGASADTGQGFLDRIDCIEAQLVAHRKSLNAPVELFSKVVNPIRALSVGNKMVTFSDASITIPAEYSGRMATLSYNVTMQINTLDPSHDKYLILTVFVNGQEIQSSRSLDTGRYVSQAVTTTTILPNSEDPIPIELRYRSSLDSPEHTDLGDWMTAMIQVAVPAAPEWPVKYCGPADSE